MKIVSLGYGRSPEFTDPEAWLNRIRFYTVILEQLALTHRVESIEQIRYNGILKKNGVVYHFLHTDSGRFPSHSRLHQCVRQLKPDVVLMNGFIYPLSVVRLKRLLGKRVKIIILHRAEKPFSGIKKWLQAMADSWVDAYLFSSAEQGKIWTEKGIIKDAGKIHEGMQATSVFSPVEKTTARAALSVDGSPVFLWVGRLDANKDPLTVLKAFSDFLCREPRAKLYFIYHSEELLALLKGFIAGNGILGSSVRWIGPVSHHQMGFWYSSADFFVSGSHYEGSGISLCEAMSCGCIPVVTDIPSFRKMTGPGTCGLLFQPGDEKDLLRALQQTQLMDREKEREKVLKQFNDELSKEAIAAKIHKLIASL
jgi:glycosyltransferase involved in cell wall biosynthesis